MINMRDMDLNIKTYSLNGLRERWELLNFLDQQTAQSAQANKNKFTAVLIRLEPRKKAEAHHHKFEHELLQYTTSTLRLTLNEGSCQLFHYSAGEIMGVFPDVDKKDLAGILLAINKNFKRRPFLFRNELHPVKVKIGVSCYPRDGWEKEELLRRAAVSAGHTKLNKYRIWSCMDRFNQSWVKPAVMSLFCVLTGALLFFGWSNLDATSAIKTAAAKMLLGKSSAPSEELVKVVTKSGAVFQGFLVSETDRNIIVTVTLDMGKATVTFSKAEVQKILRGKDALASEKFDLAASAR